MTIYILDIETVFDFLEQYDDLLSRFGFSKRNIIIRAFGPMLLSIGGQTRFVRDWERLSATRLINSMDEDLRSIAETINRSLELDDYWDAGRITPQSREVGAVLRIISDTAVVLGECVLYQCGGLPPHAIVEKVMRNSLVIRY